jgi:hypothetical protein
MTEREADTEIMMRLPDQDSELVRFTETNKILYLFFYLTRQPKNFFTSGAWTLCTDSIVQYMHSKQSLSRDPASLNDPGQTKSQNYSEGQKTQGTVYVHPYGNENVFGLQRSLNIILTFHPTNSHVRKSSRVYERGLKGLSLAVKWLWI